MSLSSARRVSGYDWVQSDVSYRYDKTQHLVWIGAFAIPILLCWVLIFPIISLYLIYNSRFTLEEDQTRAKWGYFYNEYRLRAYFWEFVKIYQKTFITIFLTYYQDMIIIKGTLVFICIFTYGILVIRFSPYKSEVLNFIDLESTVICCLSMCMGVLIYAAEKEQLSYLVILFIILVAIINLIFVLQMVFMLFQGYSSKFEDKLDQIRIKINEKYPDLGKKYPSLRKFLIVRSEMRIKVFKYWAQLRNATKEGIQRIKLDKSAPFFFEKTPITQDIKRQTKINMESSDVVDKIRPKSIDDEKHFNYKSIQDIDHIEKKVLNNKKDNIKKATLLFKKTDQPNGDHVEIKEIKHFNQIYSESSNEKLHLKRRGI